MSAQTSPSALRDCPDACSYDALVDLFERERPAHRPLLVCIDGAGASGKSTLATRLAAVCGDVQVVQLDDFYRPSSERYVGPVEERLVGADFDLGRLRGEVLEPLRAGGRASHRVYDWETDAVSSELIAVTRSIVVVEGVYSFSWALSELFDVSLWVECPRDVRLARGLARDGEGARARWEADWMVGEDQYVLRESPRDRATLVCDGNRDSHCDVVILRKAAWLCEG